MATPQWNAPHNGILGDASAFQNTGDANQLLGTHGVRVLYAAEADTSVPGGTGATAWSIDLSTLDVDQPFEITIGGLTNVGRMVIPVLAVGNGADMLVSVCTDNGGLPGTVLGQTRIPADWIVQQSNAVGLSGPNTELPVQVATGSPLATAQSNTLLFGEWQSVPWSPPATSATGGLDTAQLAQSGDYFVFAGGVNAANGNSSATVVVITWTGSTTISAPAPGPPLPQALLSGAFAVTPDALVYAGGVNIVGATSTVESTVYLASWDPSTGSIGTWSIQTALPHTLVDAGTAVYGPTDTVYVVGGSTNYAPETNFVSTVYYSSIQDQQISGWLAGPPLPVQVADPSVAVVGNWLIVAGGYLENGDGSTSLYYAPINPATGVPGSWQLGPEFPAFVYMEGVPAVSDTGIAWPQTFDPLTGIVVQDTLTISWSDHGPGVWTHQTGPITVLNQDQVAAIVAVDGGSYQIFNFQDTSYITASVLSVPKISVPIPISGLTNGALYHLLIQQQGGDDNDYLRTLTDSAVYPAGWTALTSPRLAYSWTTAGPAGTAVPISFASNSAPVAYPTPPARNTWEDNGARVTTLVHNTSPDGAFIGILEATAGLTAQNANTGFQTGLSPWTVTGGTFARSTTQVFDGVYSCQIIPSGSASSVFITSEIMPCMPGQSLYLWAPVWFTNAVTSNYSLSVNWYTIGNILISTSSNVISAPAATWTQTSNIYTPVSLPSFAYRYSIQITLSGTPAASQVWYVGAALGGPLYVGEMNSSVTAVNYAEPSYPLINAAKPTGLTRLA